MSPTSYRTAPPRNIIDFMDDFRFFSERVITYISFAELKSRYIDFSLDLKGRARKEVVNKANPEEIISTGLA
jgi:hypothetical protein